MLPSLTGFGNMTFNNLVTALIVILLFVDVYIRVMTAIKTYRDEKRRKSQPVHTLEERVQEHEVKLKRDHERLDELEGGSRIMMRALMAMLSHEISGNSVDKLKKSMDDIQSYLIDR